MNLRKLPKVRHRKGKYLGKNLWECSDARATSESKFEGSAAGGGYKYLGYENPLIKIEKKNRKILRKGTSSTVKPSEPPTRTTR